MRHRSHINVWIAFTDFFCAIGLLMLGLYGGAQNRMRPVIEIDTKARAVVKGIYSGLAEQGWPQVKYDPKRVAIEIPEAALFDFQSCTLNNPQLVRALAKVLNQMDREVSLAGFSFVITGHTDDYGPSDDDGGYDGYNMSLSRQRADAVARLLLNSGIDPRKIRISTRGVGPRDPNVDNCSAPNPEGKPRYDCLTMGLPLQPKDQLQANRRIELTVGIYSAATEVRQPSK